MYIYIFIYIYIYFQTKTGIPKTLQKQWESDITDPWKKSGSMHSHIRKFHLLPDFLSNYEKEEFLRGYVLFTYGR